MSEPVATTLDDAVLADIRHKAKARGMDVATYIARLEAGKTGVREYAPPTTQSPPPKTATEILAEQLSNETQMAMLRGFRGGSGGGETPRFPSAAEIALEMIRLQPPQAPAPPSKQGIDFEGIINASVMGKVVKQITSDDDGKPSAITALVDARVKEVTDKLSEMGGKLEASEKARSDETRVHEREALEAQIEEIRGRYAEVVARLENRGDHSGAQAFSQQANEFLSQIAAIQTVAERAKATFAPTQASPGKDLLSQIVAGIEGLSKGAANFAETASKMAGARKGGELTPDYTQPSPGQLYRSQYAEAPPPPPPPPAATPPAAPAAPAIPAAPTPPKSDPLNPPAAMSVSETYGRGPTPPPAEAPAPPPPPPPAGAAPAVEAPAPPAPLSLQTATPEQMARAFPAGIQYLDPRTDKVIPRNEFIARYGELVLAKPELVRITGDDKSKSE